MTGSADAQARVASSVVARNVRERNGRRMSTSWDVESPAETRIFLNGACNSAHARTKRDCHQISPCCIAGCNRFQWVLASASLTRADVRMSAGAVGYGDHAAAGRRAASAFSAPMIVLVDGDAARDYDARRPAPPRPLVTRGRADDAGAGARRDHVPQHGPRRGAIGRTPIRPGSGCNPASALRPVDIQAHSRFRSAGEDRCAVARGRAANAVPLCRCPDPTTTIRIT
jgi:hypothetical protein